MQMRLVKLKQAKKNAADHGHLLTLLEPNQDDILYFYDRDQFHHILRLERMRSERSQHPLLLMLLDISATANHGHIQETLTKILSAICPALREADIRGWYHYNKTIGIIFTGIPSIDANSIEVIIRKIHKQFQEALDPGLFGKINIFFHIYPRTS
jgi:hypothetical protein